MGGFDNQTGYYNDINVNSRRVTVTLALVLVEPTELVVLPSEFNYLDNIRLNSTNFTIDFQIPNYAVFGSSNNSFSYSLTPTNESTVYSLVLEFKGQFQSANYDPQIGVLFGGTPSFTKVHQERLAGIENTFLYSTKRQ